MRFPSVLLGPTLAIGVSVPVSAVIADTPVCKRDLSPVSNTLRLTKATLNVLTKMTGEEKCDAYRRQLFAVVSARNVIAACNTGVDRNDEITRFDQVIEDVNSGIADNCP